MKVSFDGFFTPDTYETTKAKAIVERSKDNLLYPTYSVNTTRLTNQITNAEISELYVKHVVIGNNVIKFARELIKKVEE